MAITVNPDSLAADGAALADRQTVESPRGCEPAGGDSVSAAVAAQLSVHSASLATLITHAQQVRAEGGAVMQHTAASLRAADEDGAAVIAGNTSTSAAVSAPMMAAAVPAPVLPEIPPMPPPATIPGEAQAIALYTGPGAASLRELADRWQSVAATLDNVATETSRTSAAISADWSDGSQRAGANTAAHSTWWSEIAGRARTLASAADEAADHYDRAVAATPSPQEFADARHRLAEANAANVASRGLLSGQVSAAAAQLAHMQSQAADAASIYYTAAAVTTGSIAGTPTPAPPIATGGGSAAAHTQNGQGSAAKNTAAAGSAQPAPNAGVTAANTSEGTPLGIGGGSSQQVAESLLPAATTLPMTAMMPMSALSGLSGLPGTGNNTPTTMAARSAGWPDEAAPDAGLSGDLGDTSPAAGGGGGPGAVGEATPPPVSRSSPSSATAVSGPAASVGTPAEGAATAAAGGAGVGGMTTYPPMTGASGAGDGGVQRHTRLFPDRRAVWRPVPNTEAVFGELQRERRSRGKGAAPEEGTHEG
jgi:hypothetical protein